MRVFEDGPCADGLKRAHPNVVAERHGAREVLPADAGFFTDRQRGRHDGAAGMRSSPGIVIVRFVGMSEFPVGDGRLDGSEENIRSHHRANIRAAIGAGKFQGHASRGSSEPEIMAAKVSRMWCLVSCRTFSGNAELRASLM